jgi:phage terminase small subunit
MADLTDKQRRFVEEYPIDFNATQAAIRAGYSENTAGKIGWENLQKPEIVAALNETRQKLSERTGITEDRIMQEYARLGLYDIRKAVKWRSDVLVDVLDPDTGETAGVHKNDVALVNSDDLDDDTALAISEVKMDARGGLSIKFHDKKAALDSMAKHLGMFDGKKGADDPEDSPEAENLRALGRKMAFLLSGATEGA